MEMLENLKKMLKDKKNSLFTQGVIYAPLLVTLYFSAYKYLIKSWNKPDYNYCYLIPIVIIYLIWKRREELSAMPSRKSWWGLLPLVFGIGLYFLGDLGGEFFTLYMSSWFVVVGLCWLHLGWEKLKLVRFPLFLMLTMFTPPNFIYGNVSLRLKLISSRIGVWLLQNLGVSAYREGNIIDLGFTRLQVVDACSGLRYLIPLIVLSILVAYFYRSALWKKVVLVVSAIPISIFVNAVRIATVGLLYPVLGVKITKGFCHDLAGWVIFMVSFGLMALEMWLLNKIFKEPAAESGSGRQQAVKEKLNPKPRAAPFAVALVLLFATLAIAHTVEFREKIPIKNSLAGFPLQVGKWSGQKLFLEADILDALDLSDYVLINYNGPDGKLVTFYVAYYESQKKGESIHSPASCLPGSGWVFKKAGDVTLHVPWNGRPGMTVRRAFMTNNLNRRLMYYWFPARGRILTNLFQLKFYTFWDALVRQRTDGALVRLTTPVYPAESVNNAEERLQAFAGRVVPLLEQFLPD